MPKIYSDNQREEIKEEIMKVSLKLIKDNGFKKLRIEEITKSVGIAQGTFYNFFKSREILVYELAKKYDEKVNRKVDNIIKDKGFLIRDDVKSIYREMMLLDEDNVYRFLSNEDIKIFLSRLPKEYYIDLKNIKEQMQQNLLKVDTRRTDIDFDSIINWVQLMNITIENRALLVNSNCEKVIDKLIENMLDEIF